MNETLKTIAKRYSCRAFDGNAVERDALEAIALAAVQSPSAMNAQPWQIVVISDKALIDELDAAGLAVIAAADDKSMYDRIMSRGGKMFYDAPCMFLILQKPGGELDVGIVSENIALAADSLGFGNVICGMARIPFGGPNGDALRAKVGMTDGWEFGMSVLVGHAVSAGKPHEPDMSKIRYIG